MTATTTLQNNNMIDRLKKNNPPCCTCGTHLSASLWRSLQNSKFEDLTTTLANDGESFMLCLYFKTVCTNPVTQYFPHFVNLKQIAILLTIAQSSISKWRFRCRNLLRCLNSQTLGYNAKLWGMDYKEWPHQRLSNKGYGWLKRKYVIMNS